MDFDQWLRNRTAAAEQELTFRQIRQGVQAVQKDYLSRTRGQALPNKPLEGRAKRAAFATFYAAIHFRTVQGWLEAHPFDSHSGLKRIFDLGCGTGAVGSAIALGLQPHPEVKGLDRSAWAVAEARETYRAFGLQGTAKRITLPGGLPRGVQGELMVAGWSINELDDAARSRLLPAIGAALDRGAGLLIFEPISERISPWWPSWQSTLSQWGTEESKIKIQWERPDWIARMDKAARMDHRILSARVLSRKPGMGVTCKTSYSWITKVLRH